MARSEGQALQIAVILFAFLTIILSITTFYFFSEYSKATQAAEEADQARTQAEAGLREAMDELEQVKELLGLDPQKKLSELAQTIEQDKKDLFVTFPDVKQTYRDVLIAAMDRNLQLGNQLADLRTRLDQLQAQIDQQRQQDENRFARAKTVFDQRTNQFVNVESATKEREDRFVAQTRQLQQQLNQKNTQINQLKNQIAKLQQDFQAMEQRYLARIDELTKRIEGLLNHSFEVADGEITFVNARNRTVWINLGQADGLRTQLRFNVYSSAGDVDRREAKGEIEVTQILGAHLAEAQILRDSVYDPISRGDVVYTSLWHPGRSERFALAGKFDLDGDGIDDLETVRSMVALAGGKIDVELPANGQQKGKLTIYTRYLVVGEIPEQIQVQFSQLHREATQLGVKIITLDKFRDQIGLTRFQPVIRFGAGANPEVFMQPGSKTVDKTPFFRPRRPPQRKNGAY